MAIDKFDTPEETEEEKEQRLEFERKEKFVRSFAAAAVINLLDTNMSVVAIKDSKHLIWAPCYTDDELPVIRCMYCLNTNEIKFIDLDYDTLQHAELMV